MKDNRISQEVAERVLHALRDKMQTEFSSHDFLKVYCAQDEGNYIDWLERYRESEDAFKKAHAQISYFLSKNIGELQPLYHKIGRRKSETVHGTISRPMWFAWG